MYIAYGLWSLFCVVACIFLNFALIMMAFDEGAEGSGFFIMILTHTFLWILLWGIPTVVVIGISIYRWMKRRN